MTMSYGIEIADTNMHMHTRTHSLVGTSEVLGAP